MADSCNKPANLTDGFAVTEPTDICFSTIINGVLTQGVKRMTPTPDGVVASYWINGVEVQTPSVEYACPRCDEAAPVYVCNLPDASESLVSCTPSISEVFGPTDVEVPFTGIAVSNPQCCNVVVTTSAGVFTVRPDEDGVTESFDCAILLISVVVTGSCDPTSVHTILSKRF